MLAFAWLAGWIGRDRVTAQTFTDAIEATGPPQPGFRRAHTKGVCVSGVFQGTPEGAALSSARVFRQRQVPVLGRLSIGGGDPHGADNKARVRSMALQLVSDDGQEWRMAMNSFPFFAVPTAEAFLEQTRAGIPDPATGKPDPAKMAAVLEKYPSARAFQQWAKTAPWSNSWANTAYNGVNSFRFTAADGSHRFVRWSMRPQAPFEDMTPEQRAQSDDDFLSEEFARRLAQGPVRWDMGDHRQRRRPDQRPLPGLAGGPPPGEGRHADPEQHATAGHRRLPRSELRSADPAQRRGRHR